MSIAGIAPAQAAAAFGEPSRSAQYASVRDGTRLAINIYRPTRNEDGRPVEVSTPLPVVWVFTSSRRATVAADGGVTPGMSDGLDLVRNGYVFAVAETRGRGASFGTRAALADLQEARDAYDITEWLAAQPWSNGNIGMYGGASLGRTQLSAAHFRPPHLKALFLGLTEFDRYDGWHRGGIPDNPATSYSKVTTSADSAPEELARLQRVDTDADGSLLRMAFAQHAGNVRVDEFFRDIPLRDSVSPRTGDAYWLSTSISRRMGEIGKPGLAIYHAGGWYADSRRDTLLMFRNLRGSKLDGQHVVIGPWNPASPKPEREAVRQAFFDRYLKGAAAPSLDTAPIRYFTMNAPAGQEWRSTKVWPLEEERRESWFLAADGRLEKVKPAGKDGFDSHAARYDIASQSQFEVRGEMNLSTADRDAKSLHFTSAVLVEDLEVTGHPVARIWISANAPDVDVFMHLEHVDAAGNSTYVTDGRLRASHRKQGKPYYDTAGLPWHRSFGEDIVPLPAGEPVELAFDLLPTSFVFRAGSRIRIAISHADPATLFLRSDPAPTVTVHRSPKFGSRIDLPIVKSIKSRGEQGS